MNTQEIIEAYQNEFIRLATLYNNLRKEFDEYRGKELSDSNREVVETVFTSIESVWESLQPFFLFNINNHAMSKLAIHGHNEFIDDLIRHNIITKKEERH
jgi:hypothetical protein